MRPTDHHGGTSLESIAERAGVTRGAVHHHFDDKRALFVEVFRAVEHEVNDAIVSAALAAPPHERMRAGCRAMFDLYSQPGLRQIAVADAPSVLGLVDWYEIDRGVGMPTMRAGVRALADSGVLDDDLVEPVAILLFGAVTEAALTLSTGLSEVGVDEILDALERVIGGLSAEGATPRAPGS